MKFLGINSGKWQEAELVLGNDGLRVKAEGPCGKKFDVPFMEFFETAVDMRRRENIQVNKVEEAMLTTALFDFIGETE